jgi:hypothetical protein
LTIELGPSPAPGVAIAVELVSAFLNESSVAASDFFRLSCAPFLGVPSPLSGAAFAPDVEEDGIWALSSGFFSLSTLFARGETGAWDWAAFPFPFPLPAPASFTETKGLLGMTGDEDGLGVAFFELSPLSKVIGPLGTIGWAREKWTSSSVLLALEGWICTAFCFPDLWEEELTPFAVINASRSGVDSGFEGSTVAQYFAIDYLRWDRTCRYLAENLLFTWVLASF